MEIHSTVSRTQARGRAHWTSLSPNSLLRMSVSLDVPVWLHALRSLLLLDYARLCLVVTNRECHMNSVTWRARHGASGLDAQQLGGSFRYTVTSPGVDYEDLV